MKVIGVALALLTVCATIASAQTFFFGDEYVPDYKLMPADVACWLHKNKSIDRSGFDAWVPVLSEVVVDVFDTDPSIVGAIMERLSGDLDKSDSARNYVFKTLAAAVADMQIVVLVEGENGPELIKEKEHINVLEHIMSARCAMSERVSRPDEVEAVVPEEAAEVQQTEEVEAAEAAEAVEAAEAAEAAEVQQTEEVAEAETEVAETTETGELNKIAQ